jgi:hypothetical protein
MEYPEILTPRSIEPIELPPSGREAMVPKAPPRFRPWSSDSIAEDRYGKCVLDLDGEIFHNDVQDPTTAISRPATWLQAMLLVNPDFFRIRGFLR